MRTPRTKDARDYSLIVDFESEISIAARRGTRQHKGINGRALRPRNKGNFFRTSITDRTARLEVRRYHRVRPG